MRRVTLVVVAVLLAVVPAASAKVGVEFQKDPSVIDPGEETGFMVMAMSEPRGPEAGDPQPVVGVRPLVTFRNADTGQTVRVRTGRTGHEGIAFGRVTFPSRGTWSIEVKAPGLTLPGDYMQEFELGATSLGRVVETVDPPADVAGPAGGSFPWLVLAIGVGLLALGGLVLRFGPRRLRTILPARFGGAA